VTKETYYCDVCGAEKRIANKWFRCASYSTGIFNIAPWAYGSLLLENGETEQHVCGMDCAVKAMQAALAPQTSEAQR
jgi:hypothetical protein